MKLVYVGLDIDVNEVNMLFAKVCWNDHCDDLRSYDYGVCDGFSFCNITEYDVFTVVFSVKSNAIGLDNIHPKFLKLLLPSCILSLTYIFDNIITLSNFPNVWKYARIIPIAKNNSKYCNEFRPISFLSFLSKAFEHILYSQIIKHIEENHLLFEFQSGLRKFHSCTLNKICDDIRLNLH